MEIGNYLLIALICVNWGICDAYRILAVFPIPGKSHGILADAFADTLLEAGHEVTLVTAFPRKSKTPNLTEVDVKRNKEFFNENTLDIKGVMNKQIDFTNRDFLFGMMYNLSMGTITNPNMQKLMRDPKQKFDVIVGEYMFSENYALLQAVFDCPFIWFSTIEPHWMVTSIIDEPLNPSYHSDFLNGKIPPLSFIERVKELWTLIGGMIRKYYQIQPLERKLYSEWIVPALQERGKPIPSYDDLVNNVSLVIGNSHVSLGIATKLPQNYKSAGGYHISDHVDPLPEDLKKIMDNAKNGVIYFSMGSNLKSKDMPEDMKRDILNVFGELNQTVLWKFEEVMTGLPKNVHILKWAPQPSILSHPNCVLFITHGGLLSTTETIHFGVPIIGIPVFADQFINVNVAVQKGLAKKVDLSYTMAGDLKAAIIDILSDPKYTETVKMYSLVYHDRPVPPKKELVHWIEHVVKTRGAPHLRTPGFYVPFYQKMFLDLFATVVLVLLAARFILNRIVCKISFGSAKTKLN
ncbi:hypothetical protein K1T71_012105 [Dendrolimus kikuchii]|uniref:Uncharacterized protein n=1 Tax=Dendrolimus kikuchii TaxID=765133 RepID=A0ACC1CKX6_9NEOP|nr:hypothetical protein K1T71_012105 [Dendrolimus kikuchii]